jgi:transposase
MTTQKLNRVGIDVSAKELVLAIEYQGKVKADVVRFDNTATGHCALIKHLTKSGRSAQVALEATGIYHVELALALAATPRTEVMVLNPKVIKHFAVARQRRAKTDPIDAQTILSYLQCTEFRAWQAPSHTAQGLRAVGRRLCQLRAELIREQSHAHAVDQHGAAAQQVARDIEVNQNHLKRRIERMEQQALELIKDDETLTQQFRRLVSIKGIADTSAIQILSELVCMPKDMQARQWVAHAGLDPRAIESGSSVHPRRRISKAGNKYLRTALYMPAWVAVRYEPAVTAYYEHLVAQGKARMQAIVAVMRKLLHAIWGMLHHNVDWDPTLFYRNKKELNMS